MAIVNQRNLLMTEGTKLGVILFKFVDRRARYPVFSILFRVRGYCRLKITRKSLLEDTITGRLFLFHHMVSLLKLLEIQSQKKVVEIRLEMFHPKNKKKIFVHKFFCPSRDASSVSRRQLSTCVPTNGKSKSTTGYHYGATNNECKSNGTPISWPTKRSIFSK